MTELLRILTWLAFHLLTNLASAQVFTTAVPTYAPIPTEALGPVTNEAGYRVESFGHGAYMVTDNSYNGIFLVSNKGVIVVDNPPTIGRSMLYAIGNTTNIPITHVVYSHSHADHIGGVYLYGDKVKRIAHRFTKEILQVLGDPMRPIPDTVFDDDYCLTVGNQTLRLSYKGLNHQPGNIFIYAPAQKVLMLVDIIFPGWTPFAALGQGEFIPGVIKAHDQVLAYDFQHFVGGHLTKSGTRADVEMAKEYILDLRQNCAAAIALTTQASSATNPIAASDIFAAVRKANPNNPWAAFKVYLDDVSLYCANVTNTKWLGKLAAVDTFGFENAFAMVESLRIDYDVLGPFAVV